MRTPVWVGYGRLLPGDLAAFDRELETLAGFTGVAFLDPEDGVHPLLLAQRARHALPGVPLLLPLVARDTNRTGLMSVARATQALGGAELLLLSGHLDPASPARPVYELDPLQLLPLLRGAGVDLPAWVSSRCATAAERARAASLAAAGAARCLVPWDHMGPGLDSASLEVIWSVDGPQWSASHLPEGGAGQLWVLTPGQAAAAAARRRELAS